MYESSESLRRPVWPVSLLARPGFWLLLQMAVAGGWLAVSGRLQPEWVPDSASYVEFPFETLRTVLSHNRTVGYPLFLAGCRWLAADHAAVPVVHWLFHCAAVLLFYASL